MKAGVIGVGDMGSGLARNLIANGFETSGFDLSETRMADFAKMGGVACSGPGDVGRHADAVFIMVMNGDQAKEVILGDDGLSSTMDEGGIILLTATIKPAEAREIVLAHVGLVPVRAVRVGGDDPQTRQPARAHPPAPPAEEVVRAAVAVVRRAVVARLLRDVDLQRAAAGARARGERGGEQRVAHSEERRRRHRRGSSRSRKVRLRRLCPRRLCLRRRRQCRRSRCRELRHRIGSARALALRLRLRWRGGWDGIRERSGQRR